MYDEEPRPRETEDDVARLVRLAGGREEVPAERSARVEAAVREVWLGEVRHRSRRRKAYWTGGLALAATVIVALVFAGRFAPGVEPVATVERMAGTASVRPGEEARRPLDAGALLHAGAEVESAPGGRVVLRLAGGETLRLDEETRLLLLDRDAFELLSGALYVDTGGGNERRLEVRTRLGTARDIGTRFLLELGAGGLRVRVREGEVELTAGGSRHRAAAGVELAVDAEGTVTERRVDIYGAPWEWVLEAAEPFELEGARLGDFLDYLTREAGLEVRFDDPGLEPAARDIVLHGSVEGMTVDDAVAVVLPTCGLEHRLEDGVLRIAGP